MCSGKIGTTLVIWITGVTIVKPVKKYNTWCTVIFSEISAERENIYECIYVSHVALKQCPIFFMMSYSTSLSLSSMAPIALSEWSLTRNGE